MKKIQRQPGQLVSRPPRRTPTEVLIPVVVLQTPNARLRAAPSGKAAAIIASVMGDTKAADS